MTRIEFQYFAAYKNGQPVPDLYCEFSQGVIARKVKDQYVPFTGKHIAAVLQDGERFQCSRRKLLADTALAVMTALAQGGEGS